MGLEHPNVLVSAIDLAEADGEQQARALAMELMRPPLESVLLRRDQRLAARLQVTALTDEEPARCPGAAILITGGLGALGLALARRFAGLGATLLVLAGRDPGREAEAVEELRSQGVTVLVERCDLTRADEPARLLASLAASGVRLTGVVHAAGELADGVLTAQSEASLERALAAKAHGAERLLQALSETRLDFLGLISSLAGTTGAPGQGSYGAANAYLDGLAAARRTSALPVCSIALGPVAAGMGKAGVRAASALGLRSLPLETVVHELAQRLLRPTRTWQLLTGPLDEAAKSAPATSALRLLMSDWVELAPAATEPDSLAELRRQGPGQVEFIQRWLQERVGEALHCRAQEVALDRGLLELGLDSLLMLQLRARLEQAFGVRLEPAALFSHPTIDRLARHLFERLAGPAPELSAPASTPQAPLSNATTTDAFLQVLEAMDEGQALRMSQETAR